MDAQSRLETVSDRTIGDLIATAGEAYDALIGAAEEVEDEWEYTTDLSAAWQERLDRVAATRGVEAAPPGAAAAVDALILQAAAIDDPHRAIDWLSTFPQVLLVALGERP